MSLLRIVILLDADCVIIRNVLTVFIYILITDRLVAQSLYKLSTTCQYLRVEINQYVMKSARLTRFRAIGYADILSTVILRWVV